MEVKFVLTPLSHRTVPYYFQIVTLLRRKIEEGDLPSGLKLPNELELAKLFGVSRVPVRRALSMLEADGLLVRQRGRGTFVADVPPAPNYYVLSGTIEDYLSRNLRGTLRLLSMEKIPAPRVVADFLGIETGETVSLFRRIRAVNGVPYSYVMNYVLLATVAHFSIKDLNELNVVNIFAKCLGVSLQKITQAIEARSADSDIAAQLSIDVASPVMCVETFFRSHRGSPEALSRIFYRGDRHKYLLELTRKN